MKSDRRNPVAVPMQNDWIAKIAVLQRCGVDCGCTLSRSIRKNGGTHRRVLRGCDLRKSIGKNGRTHRRVRGCALRKSIGKNGGTHIRVLKKF